MSIKVMTDIWEHAPFVGTDLLVLLALADMANDDRECWPGLKNLAHKGRITTRQVSYVIENLVLQGIITITPRKLDNGSQTSNMYYVKPVEEWDLLVQYALDNPHEAQFIPPMKHSSSPPNNRKGKTAQELKREPKGESKIPKAPQKRSPLPMKFPSNPHSFTHKHIVGYQKQYADDLKPLIQAWAGDMYISLTEFSDRIAHLYIETYQELERLHIPPTDYPALVKHTRIKDYWKSLKVTDILYHVTDYKPSPSTTNRATSQSQAEMDAKIQHDYEEMFGAK